MSDPERPSSASSSDDARPLHAARPRKVTLPPISALLESLRHAQPPPTQISSGSRSPLDEHWRPPGPNGTPPALPPPIGGRPSFAYHASSEEHTRPYPSIEAANSPASPRYGSPGAAPASTSGRRHAPHPPSSPGHLAPPESVQHRRNNSLPSPWNQWETPGVSAPLPHPPTWSSAYEDPRRRGSSSSLPHTPTWSHVNPEPPRRGSDPEHTSMPILVPEDEGSDSGRYACPHCNKRFARPSSLRIHIHSHTGEKPFSCQLCGRGFSVQSNLRRHVKIHRATTSKDSDAESKSKSLDEEEGSAASFDGSADET